MTTAITKSNLNAWTLPLFTLFIWLLAGFCASYWVLKFVTTKPLVATTAQSLPNAAIDTKAIAKLLGAVEGEVNKPMNVVPSTKFVLSGLAFTTGGRGVALIALDEKPAKPYRVGSLVADDLVLKSISKNSAVLGSSMKSPDALTLEMPERKPATSQLSSNMTKLAPVVPAGVRVPAMNQNASNQAIPPSPISAPVGVSSLRPGFIQPNAPAAAAISRFAPKVSGEMPDVLPPSRAIGSDGLPTIAER